jgi:hypothetical protein
MGFKKNVLLASMLAMSALGGGMSMPLFDAGRRQTAGNGNYKRGQRGNFTPKAKLKKKKRRMVKASRNRNHKQ